MKWVVFLGDSLSRLREFPEDARKQAGVQLHRVQLGLDPADWKPLVTVGPGVRESAFATTAVLFGCSIW